MRAFAGQGVAVGLSLRAGNVEAVERHQRAAEVPPSNFICFRVDLDNTRPFLVPFGVRTVVEQQHVAICQMCRVVLMGYFTWSPFPRKFSSFSRHNSNGADSPKADEKIIIVGQLQRIAMSPFAATVQRADDFFGNV